ncbi:MAG: hypothetical protein MUD01_01545 [Chloroflexaceae bacterium]|nr:hypothetical protein [Chloroflexaceae bacterium]
MTALVVEDKATSFYIMREVDLPIPAHTNRVALPELVEAACESEGLTLTLRTTLAAYPGCMHWHYKRGAERGTSKSHGGNSGIGSGARWHGTAAGPGLSR